MKPARAGFRLGGRQLLCAGAVLGEGQVAPVYAKRCLRAFTTETHDGFNTVFLSGAAGPAASVIACGILLIDCGIFLKACGIFGVACGILVACAILGSSRSLHPHFCGQTPHLVRVRSLPSTRNGGFGHLRQENTMVLIQFPHQAPLGLQHL